MRVPRRLTVLDRLAVVTKPRPPAVVATPLSGGPEGPAGADGADGRNAGLKYTYLTNTEETDPGSGKLKFNKATLSEATGLRISETDGDGNALAAYLATWDDSTSTIRGQLTMRKDSNPAVFAVFSISGTLTDKGTWDTFTVAYVAGGGAFANNDLVKIEFRAKGDKGDTGEKGATGGTGEKGSPGAGLPAGVTDWGLVTELPKSPTKGDRCQFIADKTNGIIWHLVYDGEGTYPWKKIGGPPLFAEVAAQQTTSSTSYTNLGTTGPTVTAPAVKMESLVTLQAQMQGESSAIITYIGLSVGGAAAVEVDYSYSETGRITVPGCKTVSGITSTASQTFQMKYRTNTGTSAWAKRTLQVDPIRVG